MTSKNPSTKQTSRLSFWRAVWKEFLSIKKEGFWVVNLPLSFTIGWHVSGSYFQGSEILKILIRIITVLLFIVVFKFLWGLITVVRKRLFIWLTTIFWGTCIKEAVRIQTTLMITQSADKQQRKQVMMSAIESLQNIMKIITGCMCGISIKIPQNPQEDALKWKMVTVLRDSSHFERDNDKYKNTVHLVSKNTAFLQIVNNLKDGNKDFKYINNDRFKDSSYETTSHGCYPSLTQYVSEIVCPIILPGDDKSFLFGLRGVLCVDCEKSYPFRNDEVTASLVSMVAYLLQPLLSIDDNTSL